MRFQAVGDHRRQRVTSSGCRFTRQRPWLKIIEKNKRRAFLDWLSNAENLSFSQKRTRDYGPEHVVLIDLAYVTGPQLSDGFSESSRCRERDSKDRKIDVLYPRVWRRAWDTAEVDGKIRFPAASITTQAASPTPIRSLWTGGFFALRGGWWTSDRRNLSEKRVVLRRKTTNHPRPDFAHAPLFDDLTFV